MLQTVAHEVASSNGTTTVTLVIAVVGLGIAIASLVWQWVSWQFEGPKLKVRVSQGLWIGDSSGETYWIITAVNVGRSPIELTGWGMELPSKNVIQIIGSSVSPTLLPHSLAGGHQAPFFMSQGDLSKHLTNNGGLPVKLRPFVSTSLDEKVYAKHLTISRIPD